MYKMYFGIKNGEEGFILPILPEKIEFNENGDNKTYDLINIGEVNTVNLPKLTEIEFESTFPKNIGPYVSSEQLFEPSFYISKIRNWRDSKQKIRFIFTGSPLEVNDLFTIENFKVIEKGGEVGDVYYSIQLKRYKPYSAKKVVVVNTSKSTVGNSANRSVATVKTSSPTRVTEQPKQRTHTVIKGDTLWYISKKYLGNGDRFKEIAKLNDIKNPDKIYTGQVLKIP